LLNIIVLILALKDLEAPVQRGSRCWRAKT